MLILKRQPEEKIYAILPDGSRIEILCKTKAKIAFKAPPGVNIVRGELLERIERSAAYIEGIERDTAEAVSQSQPPTPDAA